MNEKDAVKDFLNEVVEEKPDIFQETPQEEVIEEEEKDEKPLPFHKDPKVQRYVERQIEKALKDVQPQGRAETEFREATASDVEEVVSAFQTIIGNDTPEKVKALEALKKTLEGSDERASRKAMERFQEQMREAEEARIAEDNAALEELQTGFETIEEEYGVDLESDAKTRAAFVEYLRKVSHKNEDGEVDQFADIPSAWEEFQERSKAKPSEAQTRAKQLAARGLARSNEASAAPTGKSWRDVDRYFDTLKKTLNN